MKKKLLMLGMALIMASCIAQNPKDMNTERLTYFSFDHHNTMAMFYGEKYSVSTEKDGRIHVVIDEAFPDEKEFYLEDTTIFDALLAIVKQYKMDNYKSDYQPEMRIFDGDSWSLYYKYDSGRSQRSGGYMAWPDNYGEMRQALANYFQQWRDYQIGIKIIDFFKFTCKNNQGCDIEYTLERGEDEATLTLRDKERNLDEMRSVSNECLAQLQRVANEIRLKETMYDYYTSDENATRCDFFVRYNNGDTISAVNCYTQYPIHRESAIRGFFSQWLPE